MPDVTTAASVAPSARTDRGPSMNAAIDDAVTEFDLVPRTVGLWLLGGSTSIVAVATLSGLAIVLADDPDLPLAGALFDLFDLNREGGVAAWWSSMLLMALAVSIALVARSRRSKGWWAAAVVAGLMSLDEAVSLHERLSPIVGDLLEGDTLRTFGWIVPGAIVGVGLAIAAFRLTAELGDPATRWFRVGVVAYLTGAIAFEVVGALLFDRFGEDAIPYRLSIIAEEGLEMLGAVIMVVAALTAVAGRRTVVRVGTD